LSCQREMQMDNITKHKLLSEWTLQHVKNRIPFSEWLPSEAELETLCMELRLTREVKDRNRIMLRMFLADEKYCKACAECGYNSTCYLGGKKKTLIVIDGRLSFGTRPCEQYARF